MARTERDGGGALTNRQKSYVQKTYKVRTNNDRELEDTRDGRRTPSKAGLVPSRARRGPSHSKMAHGSRGPAKDMRIGKGKPSGKTTSRRGGQ